MPKEQNNMPSEFAMGKAARAWCAPTTSHVVMIPEVAMEFARIIDEYREALMWCRGSADFGVGGQAYEGWQKVCAPLLEYPAPRREHEEEG